VNIKTTLKSSVAAAALFAIAAPAHAGSVSNGNDTASVTLSGHFNKAILYMNDGNGSDVVAVDNTNSQSRARIIAKGKMNEAVGVSGVFEWGMSDHRSHTVSVSDPDLTANPEAAGSSWFSMRQSYVAFEHKGLGTVTLGQTNTAADGAAEAGSFGIGSIYNGNTLIGNAIHVKRDNLANGDAAATSITVGSFVGSGNTSRTSLVKYTTPRFGGFNLAASKSNGNASDLRANFGGKFGGFKVDAQYGIVFGGSSTDGTDTNQMASLGIGHDSGLMFRVSGGLQDQYAATADHTWHLSSGLAYTANLTSMGTTVFGAEYTVNHNTTTDADKSNYYSIGVQQNTDAGIQFYAGYQLFEMERGAEIQYEDVSTIVAGTRILF